VPTVRRNNCIFATLGTCYSAWMTVWYAGCNENYRFFGDVRRWSGANCSDSCVLLFGTQFCMFVSQVRMEYLSRKVVVSNPYRSATRKQGVLKPTSEYF